MAAASCGCEPGSLRSGNVGFEKVCESERSSIFLRNVGGAVELHLELKTTWQDSHITGKGPIPTAEEAVILSNIIDVKTNDSLRTYTE